MKTPGAAGQGHLADERGIVGDVDRHGGAPDALDRPQRPAEPAQVVRARAEVVVDEDGVRLAVGQELVDDLPRVAHPVRHREALGRQVAEAAAVVAAARRDEARRREEARVREQVAARGRVVAVRARVVSAVDGSQRARVDVAEERAPDLHALADDERVGVRRALLRARDDVQAAEDDLRAAFAVPARECEGAPGEGQVDGDADDLREGVGGRRALQEVLVPVADGPLGRRRGRDARQRERRGQHVLAEAGVRVLGVEGVDEQRVSRRRRRRAQVGVEPRRHAQLLGHDGPSHACSASTAPKRRARLRNSATAAASARRSKSGQSVRVNTSSA